MLNSNHDYCSLSFQVIIKMMDIHGKQTTSGDLGLVSFTVYKYSVRDTS